MPSSAVSAYIPQKRKLGLYGLRNLKNKLGQYVRLLKSPDFDATNIKCITVCFCTLIHF